MGVVERLARRVVADPVAIDRADVAAAVTRLLPSEAPLLGRDVVPDVVDAVVGLGPLEELLRDPHVSDVLVNGGGEVWVERNGSLQLSALGSISPQDLVAAVERVIAPLGLRLDPASPAVDARLGDGSRLHALVPPASVDGPVLAIRRFSETVASLDELVASDALTAAGAELLRRLVSDRKNIVIAGATGSGKTTLLNVLSQEIPSSERIVSVEDAAELRLAGHVVRLEGRPPNQEGAGELSLRELLRHALRLRPDRIIVGEVRGAEAFDLMQAMSTGHDGSMTTIHAKTADEAMWRLETLALLEPAATEASIQRQLANVVDVVVVVGRHLGRRVVRSVTLMCGVPEAVYRCS